MWQHARLGECLLQPLQDHLRLKQHSLALLLLLLLLLARRPRWWRLGRGRAAAVA
jgi:hypothetical protein